MQKSCSMSSIHIAYQTVKGNTVKVQWCNIWELPCFEYLILPVVMQKHKLLTWKENDKKDLAMATFPDNSNSYISNTSQALW